MAALFPAPKFQALASDSTLLVGGLVYTYEAGSDTPLATYTTPAGGVENANPTVLDARGEANIWFDSTKLYKIVLKTSTGSSIWSVDNFGFSADGMRFLPAGTGALARTVQDKARDVISAFDFIPQSLHASIQNNTNVTDLTSYIQAAITALLAAKGGTLLFPYGVFIFSTTLNIATANKGIIFQGAGASEAGGTDGATVLKWTGGASIMVSVGTDARNCIFRDFDVENTGTATMFCQVGFTDMVRFQNLNIRPTAFFSTAAITLGVGTDRCENIYFDNVTIRGTAVGQIGLAANRVQDLRAIRLNIVNALVTIGIAGSVDIVNAAFFGCSFNSIAAETLNGTTIYQGRSIAYHGCHFETNSANHVVHIDSTGGSVGGVLFSGCYFSGNSSNSARVIYVDLGSATVTCVSCYCVQFANPYYFMSPNNALHVTLIGNEATGTGANISSSYASPPMLCMGNTANSSIVSDRGVVACAAGTYSGGDLTPSVRNTSSLYIANGGPTSITNLDDAADGQIITMIFADGNTTITTTNFYLAGGAAFVSTAQDTLTVVYHESDQKFREVARSVNA